MKKLLLLFTLCAMLFAPSVQAACVYYTGNEYVCLSSDTKPTVVADGARAYESDTKRHFIKVSGSWTEITPKTHGSADHTGTIGDEDQINYFSSGGHTHDGAAGGTLIPDLSFATAAETNYFCSGLSTGGTFSVLSGHTVRVLAGSGYVNDHTTGGFKFLTWSQTDVDTLADGTNYIGVSVAEGVHISLSRPEMSDHVYLGHVYAAGGNTMVLETFVVPEWSQHFGGRVQNFVAKALTTLISSGNSVAEKANPNELELNIAGGLMHARLGEYTTTTTSTFSKLYNTSDYGWYGDAGTPNHVNVTQWNNVTNTQSTALVTMTAAYWKKDLLLRVTNGNVYYLFGQAEYATEDAAKAGPLPAIPASITEDTAYIASIVSQKNDTSIASRLYDIRPILSRVFGYGTAGASGTVIAHSSLTELDYASAGHTGFQASLGITGTSGSGSTGIKSTITTPSDNQVLTYSSGNWINQAGGGGGAPTTSKYLLQQADGTLPNAQSMGVLTTGLVKNTTSTGVQSIASSGTDYGPPTSGNATGLIISTTGTGAHTAYGGTSCTNQFARSLNASGAATCEGLGVADFTANQGTTAQVLHGNAAGQPSWTAITLADLPTITVAKGGSNLTTVAVDQVYVGTATDTFTAKSLPSCAVAATSKLLYDTSTHAFSCGTDQTAGGGPTIAKLTSDYTNATTTGTNVSGLNITLGAGTWRYSYWLAAQAATAANAFNFGVNFTGTSTLFTALLSYPDTGTAATVGTVDDIITGDGGELIVAQCVNTAFSTTAPNLNCITATATTGTNNFIQVEGMIVVTVSGTLQLYASSDSTTTITVKAGSTVKADLF